MYLKERDKYEQLKGNLKNTGGHMRLNSVGLKINNEFVNNLCVWLRIFFFCIFWIYQMYLISVEGYKNAKVHILSVKKNWWNLG